MTWSTRNPATDYQNGDAFTWEWAVGKAWTNGLKIGVAGYAYQQITGDSGSGAKLGPFKGRVFRRRSRRSSTTRSCCGGR